MKIRKSLDVRKWINRMEKNFTRRQAYVILLLYISIIIVVFGSIYNALNKHGNFFEKGVDEYLDGYFYSVITMFTLGSNQWPNTVAAKFVTCLQIFLFWASAIYFTMVITNYRK